jgi:prepilin-type N-terminal cleavage/methylation domain-containing protein
MPADRDSDSGFTLVEVMVTIALLGAMMAIAVSGWSSWDKARAQAGAASELQTVLRQTQQRAVTEGRAMCVWFDVAARSYTVYRGVCDVSPPAEKLVGPYELGHPVSLSAPSFNAPSGASPGVTFYARGTAAEGQVSLTRSGSAKTYLISVEGLTGRVSLS